MDAGQRQRLRAAIDKNGDRLGRLEHNLDLDGGNDRKVVTLLAARTLAVPTQIRLVCQALGGGGGYDVSHGQVVALQVAEVH